MISMHLKKKIRTNTDEIDSRAKSLRMYDKFCLFENRIDKLTYPGKHGDEGSVGFGEPSPELLNQ